MDVELQRKQELLSKAENEKKNVTETLNQRLNKAFAEYSQNIGEKEAELEG